MTSDLQLSQEAEHPVLMPRLPTDQQQSYRHRPLHHTETLDTATVPGHPQVRPITTLCFHLPTEDCPPAHHQPYSPISDALCHLLHVYIPCQSHPQLKNTLFPSTRQYPYRMCDK